MVLAQVMRVDQATVQKLGIRTQKVRVESHSPETRAPAQLKADMGKSVEVYSPLEGVVKRLYVREGDRVRRGQLLAEVYSPRIAELSAQIRMAQVRLQTAEEALKREELLYKEEVIPYARYFSAKVEYDRALAEYRALLQSRDSLGETRGDNLLVRSPGAGVMVEQKAVLGSSVGLGSPLFKVQDFSRLWAYAYAEPGLRVEGRSYLEYEGKLYPAVLEWVSPRLDPATGKQVLRFVVENTDGKLKEGLKAQIILRGKEQKGVWLPASALQKVRGEHVVFVRVQDGFEVRKVRVILSSGEKVLVEGISDGEEVAVSGVIFLRAQAEK
jgi:cobalt-zinc-cadmium efflux system membrane fusion protein